MAQELSEEIKRLLKQVYDDCQNEDRAVRERQLRNWRRLKLLWEGFNRVWFSETAHDWRIWDENTEQDTDQAYYDKPVNVFKAYLESIIAALSVTVPAIKCFPDDADNTLDLATAKAGDKISQLIYRHNDVSLLWLHALFINVTEGMTAFYNYSDEDEEYGTYKEKETEDIEENHQLTTCPECGHTLDDQTLPSQQVENQPDVVMETMPQMGMQSSMGMQQANPPQSTIPDIENQELDEFDPTNEDVDLHAALMSGKEVCPACMAMMDPEIKNEKFIVTRLIGEKTLPKSRICLEVYGGLYVKVSNFAKKQKDVPYLIFSKEDDYALVAERYKHIHNPDFARNVKSGNQAGSYNMYDQWARLSPQYQGEYPLNVVTVNKAWIRPGKFNVLDKESAAKLHKHFPDGAYTVFINDEFGEACNESLDDHWTLTENPLAEFLHFDPLGQSLVSIQEITNDLISLVLQTIEHGIGQTFADPAVLNFNAYQQTEVTPGGVFPANPKSGKSLQEGFHELRTATLSGEVLPFSQNIQSMAQLVSGALPSLFGGAIQGGGETASQYSMSRAQALQRLQNTWKLFTTTWKRVFGKVIPMYIENVKDDERDVQKDDDGNFVNTFIYRAELEGKIGKVELEANENLPMTWSQIKDTVEKILTNGNPEVIKILAAPENVGLIHDALGLVDFYVPGEDDIIKQYDEIKLLLNSEPIQTGDPQMPEVPSVEIDPIFDNNQVEFEICRKWAISEAGRQTKMTNEAGYKNVLLHGKMHYMIMQQQMMAQAGAGAAPGEKPNPLDTKEAPITGESDVQTQS